MISYAVGGTQYIAVATGLNAGTWQVKAGPARVAVYALTTGAQFTIPPRTTLATRPRKLLKRSRRCDAKVVGVGVVIPFQVGQAIHVVDRQAVRAMQSGG